MSDERWFVDTNVLLAATDTSRSTHLAALELWQHFPQEGIRLAFSGQVLREYAVVATRPIANNGLGLSLTHTMDNLRSFRSRCDFLPETELVSRLWSEMVVAYRVQGKRQHDVNI